MKKRLISKNSNANIKSAITPFSLANDVCTGKKWDEFTGEERRVYKNARYIIHRALSMNASYAPVVNILQKYTTMPERAHYLFLTNILPKGKQYNKYIKGDKEEKYEGWLVELVAKHYHTSKAEAIQYIELYYHSNKSALKELCQMYGADPKLIKKAKL